MIFLWKLRLKYKKKTKLLGLFNLEEKKVEL